MQQSLLTLINGSISNTAFATKGKISAKQVDIALTIKTLGTLTLPIEPEPAAELIDRCRLAPFGKGRKTVVNTAVRNVWELEPGKFAIVSASWKQQLKEIVKQVAVDLGVGQHKVTAKLDKLLVYEKGSFFLPHQDSEKGDGMFATLVVTLPSYHQGGKLIIGHGNESVSYLMGGKHSASDMQYHAFYADCRHEVKPVTSGYRICLVYNLHLGKSSSSALPPVDPTVKAVAKWLERWDCSSDKKAVLLDHQYTPVSVSQQLFKGRDYQRVQLLLAAAGQAPMDAYFALITYHDVGEPEIEESRHLGRWDRFYDEDGEDDGEDNDSASQTIAYVIDDDISVQQWFDSTGHECQLGDIDIDKADIVADAWFTELSPDETDYEGYMGNYGPTLERWYFRVALVIWPKAKRFDILSAAGPEGASYDCLDMVKKIPELPEAQRDQATTAATAYAEAILANQGNTVFWSSSAVQKFAEIVRHLDSAALARSLLTRLFSDQQDRLNYPPDWMRKTGKAIVPLLNHFGWSTLDSELTAASHNPAIRSPALVALIDGLQDRFAADNTPPILHLLITHFVGTLSERDKQKTTVPDSPADRIKMIETSLGRMAPLLEPAQESKLIGHYLLDNYQPMDKVLIPLLKKYASKREKNSAALNRFLDELINKLRERTQTKIAAPDHWGMDVQWSCSCQDCRQLKRFLQNKSEQMLAMPLAKQRRRHLHNVIDSMQMDVTHVTQRQGRPFTLVLKKHRNSYLRREKIRLGELEILEKYA